MGAADAAKARMAGEQAVGAIARLADLPEPDTTPAVLELPLETVVRELFQDAQTIAVCADLMGGANGKAGLVLTPPVCALLLERLLGSADKSPLEGPGYSALCEVGNIAVSAAAGALASLGLETVVPSTPRLGLDLLEALDGDDSEPVPAAQLRRAFLVKFPFGELGEAGLLHFVWLPADHA